MYVQMWMSSDVITASPQQDVAEALAVMKRRRVRRLPVVEKGALVGIVTLHHLYRVLPRDVNPTREDSAPTGPTGIPIGEIMERDVVTTTPFEPLEDVAEIMRKRKIGGVPILQHGKLVGIITESNIFEAFAQALGAGRGGVRITFDLETDPKALGKIARMMTTFAIELISLAMYCVPSKKREVFTMRVQGRDVERFIKGLWQKGYRVVGVKHEDEEDEPKDEG